MKILSISKGLKTKCYTFKLTPEEFSRLDILAKEAGIEKNTYLAVLLDAVWIAKKNKQRIEDDGISLFMRSLELYLSRKEGADK